MPVKYDDFINFINGVITASDYSTPKYSNFVAVLKNIRDTDLETLVADINQARPLWVPTALITYLTSRPDKTIYEIAEKVLSSEDNERFIKWAGTISSSELLIPHDADPDLEEVFKDDNLAIYIDLRNPYTQLGDHPEWTEQFKKAVRSQSVHRQLSEKLEPFGPIVIAYTKITPSHKRLLDLSGFDKATAIVISSVGEHAITPWMIIHNVAHTLMSWNMRLKKDIREILDLSGQYRIFEDQQNLVTCRASKAMLIPNINELMYELFTTWVWSGRTQSKHKELARHCNIIFPRINGTIQEPIYLAQVPVPDHSKFRGNRMVRKYIDR